jgi:hypothetical protein
MHCKCKKIIALPVSWYAYLKLRQQFSHAPHMIRYPGFHRERDLQRAVNLAEIGLAKCSATAAR